VTISNFLLEEKYNEVENSYKYNLSSACTPALSIFHLIDSELDLNALMKHKLDYPEQFGLEITREKIAQKIYKNSAAKNLILTSGASEAIYLTMTSLFEKDDKVIVQKPIYQSLYQILEDMGCEIIDWYGFDIDELEDLYSKDVKALIINNPNNPTGLAFKDDELKKISSVMQEKMIITDEVFRSINDDIPAITELHENAISINDLSKSFSLPGLRLGWLQVNDKKLLEKISSQKNYISLRNSSLSELLASFALDQFEKIKLRNQAILIQNKEYFFENLASLPFEALYEKEDILGLTSLVKMKSSDLLEQAFKKDVFLCDGLLIDESLESHTRIGFGLNPDDFKAALKMLR
jgi:aspartate/methionine/tyrosine aminotransferase